MVACCPVKVATPPVPVAADAPAKVPEDRDRLYEGDVVIKGKYWARASRMSARATMKFSKACLMVWLSMLSWSSRAFSSGSLKIVHHLPRGRASFGLATVQPMPSRNCVGDSL